VKPSSGRQRFGLDSLVKPGLRLGLEATSAGTGRTGHSARCCRACLDLLAEGSGSQAGARRRPPADRNTPDKRDRPSGTCSTHSGRRRHGGRRRRFRRQVRRLKLPWWRGPSSIFPTAHLRAGRNWHIPHRGPRSRRPRIPGGRVAGTSTGVPSVTWMSYWRRAADQGVCGARPAAVVHPRCSRLEPTGDDRGDRPNRRGREEGHQGGRDGSTAHQPPLSHPAADQSRQGIEGRAAKRWSDGWNGGPETAADRPLGSTAVAAKRARPRGDKVRVVLPRSREPK